MRRSIDGLATLVQESFKLDPFSPCLFVFCNRSRDRVKILEWDNAGFWIHYRRLEQGRFQWPYSLDSGPIAITRRECRWLLDGPPVVLCDYEEARRKDHPIEFLKGFAGYLHVDGYAGYNNIPNVTIASCWSHARREFDESIKTLPKNGRGAPTKAREGLNFCNQLFKIERGLKDAVPHERYEQRLKQSRPVLDAFSAWLEVEKDKVLPKSMLGGAIKYCLNRWTKLVIFLEDGNLEIDNNGAERSIKSFIMGRKAWLFGNAPRGAKSSAVCYSIVETAKENGLNPFAYLTHLFEQMPNIDVNDPDALTTLLPWSESLPERVHDPKRK